MHFQLEFPYCMLTTEHKNIILNTESKPYYNEKDFYYSKQQFIYILFDKCGNKWCHN